MSKLWSEEEIQLIESCVINKQPIEHIYKELEENGYDRSLNAIKKKIATLFPEEQEEGFKNAIEKIKDKKEEMFQMISNNSFLMGNPQGKLYKILSLSDLHIPFVSEEVVKHAIKNHGDADILVLNGDYLDLFSVSKWPKNKEYLLKNEFEIGQEYLKLFSNIFKKVVLVKGNHDGRLSSYFMSNIDPGVTFLTHPDPLERLAAGYGFDEFGAFKKIYDHNNVFYLPGICSWYIKIGKTIFAHPSSFSKIPLKTVTTAAAEFHGREDFECLVIGHTHKLGSCIWKNKLLIEQGCCCVPMEYEADPKMKFGQQTFGYAVVYMDEEGSVDFNLSKPVYFGTGTALDTKVRIQIV